jgi:hypothetical protein
MKNTTRAELIKIDDAMRTFMRALSDLTKTEEKKDTMMSIRRSYLHLAHAQLYLEELIGE